MDMRQATHKIRLEQWAEILRERQASGMSITAWCEAKGINRQSYFYWQRKLRALACEAMATRKESTETSMTVPEFAEYQPKAISVSSAMAAGAENPSAVLVVHLANGRVEIHSGADRETIQNTLQALRSLC